jgi:hypothetical protein
MTPRKVTIENELRERASRSIAKAIVSLHEKQEFPPELVFEGSVRGASALMMANGSTPEEVARLLEDVAQEMRSVDLADLRPLAN